MCPERRIRRNKAGNRDGAYFEREDVLPERSFLWRVDDYPWKRNVWNYHPEVEIHLVRSSSGLCYIGDYIGNFDAGHICVVGSGTPHDWVTLPPTKERILERDIVIQFQPEKLLPLESLIPELQGLNDFFEKAKLGIEFHHSPRKRAQKLIEEIGAQPKPYQIALLIELIATFMEASSEDMTTLSSPAFIRSFKSESNGELLELENAITFLQNNFLKSPRIEEVASTVNMSTSSFSRYFKKRTGNSYTEHLTMLKIWQAKKMLRYTNSPITHICFNSGFSNISNFNRTFLKKTGLKPSEYRKNIKNLSTFTASPPPQEKT